MFLHPQIQIDVCFFEGGITIKALVHKSSFIQQETLITSLKYDLKYVPQETEMFFWSNTTWQKGLLKNLNPKGNFTDRMEDFPICSFH